MTPSIFWMVGGIIILVGVGLWAYQRLGPMPVPQPASPEYISEFTLENAKFPPDADLHGLPDESEDPQLSIAEQLDKVAESLKAIHEGLNSLDDEWIDPYKYGSVLFDEDNEIRMVFHLPEGGYVIPPFNVEGWVPDILEGDYFKVGSKTGVAYIDYQNRLVLWAHSGLGQTMTILQQYIELNEAGNRVSVEAAENKLVNMLGSQVYIAQLDEYFNFSNIVAVVRVPPSGVEAVSDHVMDLVPYLAETYPESGFGRIDQSDTALILYFCGRALAGEEKNDRFGHWTQARFIIGMVPVVETKQGIGVE